MNYKLLDFFYNMNLLLNLAYRLFLVFAQAHVSNIFPQELSMFCLKPYLKKVFVAFQLCNVDRSRCHY